MALAPGARLGPYEILDPIGVGGMGEVFKARDTRLGRIVAIKVLPPDVASDADRRRRFEQEARAASALNHPHICTLHDIGSDDGVDFLVMELLEGQTIAERLRKGALPFTQALEYGAQIADALGAAHRHGIVHRDLKPANIMLTKSGVKLLDFGLAKLKSATALASAMTATPTASSVVTQGLMTMPGMVLGTVPYMAPEQLEGKETDARTDLFALGCVLYEMLTGKRAVDVSPRQPLTPTALDRLVERCLQKDPDDRPESARDVAEELADIRADAVSSSVSARPVPPRATRRNAITAAAAITFAVAAIWFAADRFRETPAPAHFSLAMPGRAVFVCSASPCLAAAADGSGVVFQVGEGGDTQLYWHDLKGSGVWQLATRASTPFLSPDVRWLGFLRGGRLWKLPLQHGHVMETLSAKEICPVGSVRGATWGDDGTIVFAKTLGGLWRVSADGSEPQQITQVDASKREASHRYPTFLPGGRAVLFQAQDMSPVRQDRSAIAVLSLASGRWTRIVEGATYPRFLKTGQLVYARYGSVFAVPFNMQSLTVTGTPAPVLNHVWYSDAANNTGFDVAGDGTLVYVQQNHELPRNALVQASSEGQVEPVVPDLRAYWTNELALSPDGRRLAVTVDSDDHQSAIWIYHLQEKRWQRLTAGAVPVWSPSGDRLAFVSDRDGPLNLYLVPVDREEVPQRLTNSPNQQWSESWSPDGRFLAYQEQEANLAPGDPNINSWILPLDGQTKPWLLEKGAALPAFSPDGHWVAYTSLIPSAPGRFDMFVRPFPGTGPKQLVSGVEGGVGPVWSKNASTLFYIQRSGDTRVMSRRVESFAPLRLAEPRVAFALPFSLDRLQIFVARMFAVTPDGSRLIAVRPDERQPPEINTLQVIRNWPEEVKAALVGER